MAKNWRVRLLHAGSVAIALVLMTPLHALASSIVFMEFEGDAAFPNITVSHPTPGVADFTGSAFGLNTLAQETALENAILALVQADFAPYDVTFVTTAPAGTPGVDYKVYAIDDTAFTFDFNANEDARLYGKVDALGGGFARTWAGSFSLDGVTNPYGGNLQSNPQLDISTHTIDQIGQALGNSAAHEIAHLYGVLHEGLDNGDPSLPLNLMQSDQEGVMANTNKVFSAQANAQLLAAIGPAQNGAEVPEPATLLLVGTGVIAAARRYRRRS